LGERLKACSHRPRPCATIIGEAQAVTDVRQAIALGNEEFEALSMELACGIFEQMAGLIGGEQDCPRLIDDEACARGLPDDTFQVGGDCIEWCAGRSGGLSASGAKYRNR